MFSRLRQISTKFPIIFSQVYQKRTFLSESYKCTELWNRRKNAEIFTKIDYNDLFYQLDRSFTIGQSISVLDVDLFVNGIENEANCLEVEDVIFKLRLNPETGLLADRTMHAVIRYYMAINQKEKLLEILSNRIGYGIYPDYFLSNILMNDFLKEGNVIGAAKIAVLQMLQEDFNHPILKPLSIYSCYKYLNSDLIWQPPKEPEIDPDEEEIKVRVSFIRNPYFDDHFDIIDTNHLIGKTLLMAGSFTPGALGLSSQLVGLVLWEKFYEVNNLILKLKPSDEIYKDCFEKCLEYLTNKPKIGGEMSDERFKVIESLKSLQKVLRLLPDPLEETSRLAVESAVRENEASDTQQLIRLYEQWENDRENDIKEELIEEDKEKIIGAISKAKEDILKEEQVLFYFDKEDEWNLAVEAISKEKQKFNEHQSQFKNNKIEEKEYIPPNV